MRYFYNEKCRNLWAVWLPIHAQRAVVKAKLPCKTILLPQRKRYCGRLVNTVVHIMFTNSFAIQQLRNCMNWCVYTVYVCAYAFNRHMFVALKAYTTYAVIIGCENSRIIIISTDSLIIISF